MKFSLPAVCGVLLLIFSAVPGLGVTAAAPRDSSAAEFSPVERDVANGASALLWPRPGSGTVLITVAIPAGSQDEPPEMAGLSHYLEHLLFDGFDELDERGVTEAFEQRSAYVNAFTREQATVFFALAPVAEAEATARLLVGMLTRSKIVPTTFEKERKVILEELAKDTSDPTSVKYERLRSALWRGTPLEKPVGGFEETVAATDHATVTRFWKGRYGPSTWRILITGDLPLDGLTRVLEAMAPLQTSPTLPEPTDPLSWEGWGQWEGVEAPQKQGGGMPAMGGMGGMGHGGPPSGSDAEAGTLALLIAPPDGVGRTEMEVLARWLGDIDGPLFRALSPDLAASVSAGLQPRFHRDVLEIQVEAKPDAEPEALLARLLGALESAAAGPDDADVLRIQRAWQAERVLTGQRLHYAAVIYGEALATAREGLADSVDPGTVGAGQVRKAAAMTLSPADDRRRAAWVGPAGTVQRTRLPGSVTPETRELTARTESGPFGSRVTTLPNGLVIGILPEIGGEVFGMHLLVADRSLREPDDLPGVADFMHRLLPAGTMISGSAELDRRLTRAGIDFKAADSPMIPFDNRYHVPDFSYARLEGPAESLETALEVLAEMIRQPQWDSDGIDRAVSDHEQSRDAGNRGSALAGRKLLEGLLGPGHPLARPVSGPPGDAPGIDRVVEAWGRWPDGYFAANRIILTIASPLPVEQTVEMAEDYFSGGTGEPQRGPYPAAQFGTVQDGDTDAPQMTMLWGRHLRIPDNERAAFLVAVDALSDRMLAVIREREGLAYRLGAGVRALPGNELLLSAQVGTRPENEQRVTALLRGILDELGSTTLDDDELARFAARDRRSRMLRGLSAASRAYRLGRALFEGESSPLRVSSEQRAAVTPEQVQAAAQKYLGWDAMELVIAR